MPITSLEQRQIRITPEIRKAKYKKPFAEIYLKHLMEEIGEFYYFVHQGHKHPRIVVETVGTRYITINYVRAEDEGLIPRLVAASKKQKGLL